MCPLKVYLVYEKNTNPTQGATMSGEMGFVVVLLSFTSFVILFLALFRLDKMDKAIEQLKKTNSPNTEKKEPESETSSSYVDRRVNPYRLCLNGGLTLVPLPGFEDLALLVKQYITGKWTDTPVDIVVPVFGEHANGEPWCDLSNDHINDHDCVIIGSGPGTRDRLFHLWLTEYALVARSARRISVVEAYLPMGRSDKDEGAKRVALFKFFALLSESASCGKLHKMIAPDLHASQLVLAFSRPGMLTPDITLLGRVLERVLTDAQKTDLKVCLCFPDDGAAKRFERIAKPEDITQGSATRLEEILGKVPRVYMWKRRKDSHSIKLEGISGNVDSLPGSLVILVDDEAATVGSLVQVSETIKKEYKVKECWGGVVHGIFCGKAITVLSDSLCSLDRVYSTDTIPAHNRDELQKLLVQGRIHIIPWLKDLSKMIYFLHWGHSLRGLR